MVPHRLSARSRRSLTGLLASLALLAGLLASAQPADAAIVPTAAHGRAVADQILKLLNNERLHNHEHSLKMNGLLVAAGQAHNLLMMATNTMSHQLPHELSLGGQISRSGYEWQWAGQNVAWNSDWTLGGAEYLETIMYNEQPPDNGHRLNIISSHYTQVGIAILYDPLHHKIWVTEDFARPV
jgi:uncharacterized protein YkwD